MTTPPQKQVTLKCVQRELHRMDPAIEEGSDSWVACLMLLASLQAGTQLKALSHFTKLSQKVLRPFHQRAIENQIFQADRIAARDWFKKDGGLSFFCDAACVIGYLQKERRVG